jgi:hypothetical protein
MISNFFTGSLLIYPFDEQYSVTLIYVKITLESLVILYFASNLKFRSEIKDQIAIVNKCDEIGRADATIPDTDFIS